MMPLMRVSPLVDRLVAGVGFLLGCGFSMLDASAAEGTLDGATMAAEAAAPFRNVRRFTSVVMGHPASSPFGFIITGIPRRKKRHKDQRFSVTRETVVIPPGKCNRFEMGPSGIDSICSSNLAIPQAGIFDRALLIAEV